MLDACTALTRGSIFWKAVDFHAAILPRCVTRTPKERRDLSRPRQLISHAPSFVPIRDSLSPYKFSDVRASSSPSVAIFRAKYFVEVLREQRQIRRGRRAGDFQGARKISRLLEEKNNIEHRTTCTYTPQLATVT